MDEQRTIKQNDSLHLYFRKLARVLAEAGLDIREVLMPAIYVPPTEKNVKEALWKPIQEAMYGKNSTTELLRQEEIDKIVDAITKHLAEHCLITAPLFPNKENKNDQHT